MGINEENEDMRHNNLTENISDDIENFSLNISLFKENSVCSLNINKNNNNNFKTQANTPIDGRLFKFNDNTSKLSINKDQSTINYKSQTKDYFNNKIFFNIDENKDCKGSILNDTLAFCSSRRDFISNKTTKQEMQDSKFFNCTSFLKKPKISKFEKSSIPFKNDRSDFIDINSYNEKSLDLKNVEQDTSIIGPAEALLNQKNLKTENFRIEIISNRIHKKNAKRCLLIWKKRDFVFPQKRVNKNIQCEAISIIKHSPISYAIVKARIYIKTIIIITTYVFLLLFITLFIQNIYQKYGNNLIKLCFMPLVSILIIKLVIVNNFKIMITTLILYYKGKSFINAKQKLWKKILFKFFVPAIALNHYQSILTYLGCLVR